MPCQRLPDGGILCTGNKPVSVEYCGKTYRFEWTAASGWCPVNKDGGGRLSSVPSKVWKKFEKMKEFKKQCTKAKDSDAVEYTGLSVRECTGLLKSVQEGISCNWLSDYPLVIAEGGVSSIDRAIHVMNKQEIEIKRLREENVQLQEKLVQADIDLELLSQQIADKQEMIQ